MFKKPVVFIIGAGASADYGMPLGGQLASSVAADVDFHFPDNFGPIERGDAALFQHLQTHFPRDQLQRFLFAGRQLAATISSAASVDDALYQLSDYPEAIMLGKVGVVRSIARAERNSELKIIPETRRMRERAGMDGWIEQMFSMAISGYKLAELHRAFENVTFVNFNYDRCLEHYIGNSLQRVGVFERDAENIVDGLNIIRPYGTLGSIKLEPGSLSFGNTNLVAAFNALTRIRTFTESEALHDKEQLRSAMSAASMFIFLGFGFHRQNLELLSVLQELNVRSDVQVLATVFGVESANLAQLRAALFDLLKVHELQIFLLEKTAGQMLRDLRLKITMAVG